MSNLTMIKPTHRRLRSVALAVLGTSALTLGACSTEEAEDVASDVSTEASEAASAAKSAATSATAALEDEATGDDSELSMDVSPSLDEPVRPGTELDVKLTGLNPDLGYYVSICKNDPEARVPACTGGRGDAQQWLKKEGGTAQLKEDGSADVKVRAVPTGEGVNCFEDECVVKVFGDHAEGFKPYLDQGITFEQS